MGWRSMAWVVALLACGAVLAGCAGGPLGAGSVGARSPAPDTTSHPSGAAGTATPPSSSPAHTLQFKVTGSGSIGSMTWTVGGKTESGTGVTPPWSRTFELPAGQGTQSWDLDLKGVSGSADVVVTLDDTVFSQSSVSGGGGECHTSGSVGG